MQGTVVLLKVCVYFKFITATLFCEDWIITMESCIIETDSFFSGCSVFCEARTVSNLNRRFGQLAAPPGSCTAFP